MASQSRKSITEIIPADILTLIVQEVKRIDFESLRKLRLACKGFNSQVEPLAFRSLTLISYERLPEFQAQLRRLASGQSPNSRWTKKLSIPFDSLAPLVRARYTTASATELRRHSALVTQRKHLVRAIGALHQVTSARYHLQDVEPFEEVLGALSRLPKLEHVSLSFPPKFHDKPLPLTSFTNLRTVELLYPPLFPSAVQSIQGMLVGSSPTLESLTITPYDWGRQFGWGEPPLDTTIIRVVGLETLLEGNEEEPPTKATTLTRLSGSSHVRAAPCFGPLQYAKLKKLALNTSRIALSAAVVQHLPSLTHLEAINGAAGNIDDTFWKELTRRRMRLELLRVWPLTTSAIDYLASYTGLKTLFLRDHENEVQVPFARERQLDRLVTVVLPRHSPTLENLWLDGSGEREYCVTEQMLEGVTGCRRLQHLWMLYYFPESENADGRPSPANGYFPPKSCPPLPAPRAPDAAHGMRERANAVDKQDGGSV
ncbi:hypothetical protein FA13DRAFT_1774159 [Coprinellus micaceus]|uniref:F-box domain-containing protein n=1 Tax=Coprinellus micaceus TaxID=71717 RepID=A0A4Y7TC82_COPMI|nr:hypothetical protein FA13DRAFT_1774159 [Coprinellus micaceus]